MTKNLLRCRVTVNMAPAAPLGTEVLVDAEAPWLPAYLEKGILVPLELPTPSEALRAPQGEGGGESIPAVPEALPDAPEGPQTPSTSISE